MDEIKALDLGVNDYLSKPFSLGVLKARMKRILSERAGTANLRSGDIVQIDKLDWIIGSLAKMVKLEQDVIAFDAEGISIRKTILDAVDTVYEKMEKKGITLVSEPYEDILLYHNRKWTVEVFVNLL